MICSDFHCSDFQFSSKFKLVSLKHCRAIMIPDTSTRITVATRLLSTEESKTEPSTLRNCLKIGFVLLFLGSIIAVSVTWARIAATPNCNITSDGLNILDSTFYSSERNAAYYIKGWCQDFCPASSCDCVYTLPQKNECMMVTTAEYRLMMLISKPFNYGDADKTAGFISIGFLVFSLVGLFWFYYLSCHWPKLLSC